MTRKERDLLEMLKFELRYLELGGYSRSVREPRREMRAFQDSPTCLNYEDPARTHPCAECMLMEFVPPDQRTKEVPCHHIPLDPQGRTIAELVRSGDEQTWRETVRGWLQQEIARLEQQVRAEDAASPKA